MSILVVKERCLLDGVEINWDFRNFVVVGILDLLNELSFMSLMI